MSDRPRRVAAFVALVALLATSLFARSAPTQASHIPDPTAVTIAGSFQQELGCPNDWQPECTVTALTDQGNDVWRGVFSIPQATTAWEYKAALNKTWDVSFPGGNVRLDLSGASGPTSVRFYYDHKTHAVIDSVNGKVAVVAGNFQSELGCPKTTLSTPEGDWAPDCVRTLMSDPDGDGKYSFSTTGIPPGNYEFKVALNESWSTSFPGSNVPLTVGSAGEKVTINWDSRTNEVTVGEQAGNLTQAKAHWVARDTIAWNAAGGAANTYRLHYDPTGALSIGPGGVTGGTAIDLTVDPAGLSDAIKAKFPHLASYTALKLPASALLLVPEILKGQIAVSATNAQSQPVDATALQIPGVLDDLYTYNGQLGAIYDNAAPTLRLWAPTARSVKLHLFDNPTTTVSSTVTMAADAASGTWSAAGDASWTGKYYLYEVEVFVGSLGRVVRNLVTDPYSLNLSLNSTRSQVINLDDPSLKPAGWDGTAKPRLDAFEDIVLYETHVRDFSVNDASVPSQYRGTFKAFDVESSDGMRHLRNLAGAGLTHIHLLPAFDCATINENKATWQQPDPALLATYPPSSTLQQAAVNATRDLDGFNWCYDPYHYTVPEGSYSTVPTDTTRIVEFREMVQSLNQNGLRVVMDVVYNHTNSAGQAEKSVLDKIVPGYYHRLNQTGGVETSTCCANTATEHAMMEKLMIDSAVVWARDYKVDGFRFDLMGHHMKANMLKLREVLDGLTVANDGVDGSKIYIYGEGWNFGEVANNARGVNATQLNMAGTGIGTFNDRLRDAVRGGGPFDSGQDIIKNQGFISGLSYDPNGLNQGSGGLSATAQKERLLLYQDQIRVGLTGNLADYSFVSRTGAVASGKQIDYNGSPTGYTQDPQEIINYVEAHDNETLFDITQFKAPAGATMAERVRMQNLGIDMVMLAQGVPFFQLGQDMLRSKSLDRNSYNSGDWFNKVDFTFQTNNWGVGLPPQTENGSNWPIMEPLLANPALKPGQADIVDAVDHFQEMLRVRKSSPLFRLRTAAEINGQVAFLNTGPNQQAGLVVMQLTDPRTLHIGNPFTKIVVLFNANDEAQTFAGASFQNAAFRLHPVQAASADPVVRTASFDQATGTFSVPPRTTAVFVTSDYQAALPIVKVQAP